MVCLWMLGVLLALSAHVTRGADETGFERYECYRDLCVSRLQFCSDRERRCKYCQPGHCMDKEKTPKACLPLCPQLLNPPTTPPPTTTTPRPTTAAGKTSPDQQTWTSVRSNGPEGVHPAGGVTQQGGLFLTSGVLILSVVVVVVVLVVLVILVACTLRYVRTVLRRLPAAPDEASDRYQDGLVAEEASQALLEAGLGSKFGSGTNCNGSASTVSSQPPKPTSRPGSFKRGTTVQTQTTCIMDLAPPTYTARPSSQVTSGPHTAVAPHSDDGVTALPDTQHCLLDPSSRLLTTQGQSWTDVGAVRQGFAGQPRTGQPPTSWEDHGHQNAFDRYKEETCLKSV